MGRVDVVNYLLDTHVWLWGLGRTNKLPERILQIVRNPEVVLWLSPVSVDEALARTARGHLSLGPDPLRWVGRALVESRVREATLTFAIAAMAHDFVLATTDPADRLIVATARFHGFTLITADRRLAEVPGVDVLAFDPPR